MSSTHRREPGRSQRWGGARGAVAAVLLAGVALVCLSILLPLRASSTRPAAVREITLVTRGMAFYLEGGTVPNPTIRLGAGEEVRFILRNLDPGIAHNLAIEGWEIETRHLDADASATLRVRVPEQLGTQAYVCAPHREMMSGVIEVVGRDASASRLKQENVGGLRQ